VKLLELSYTGFQNLYPSIVIYFWVWLIWIGLFLRYFYCRFSKNFALKNEKKGFLLIDKPWDAKVDKHDDVLWSFAIAEDLTDLIYNNGSLSPKVISLENQWGDGKTSVINRVKDQILTRDPKTIIFEFTPWYFHSDEKLFESFLSGLSDSLNERFYIPEINALFNSILNILSFSKEFDWWGKIDFSKKESLDVRKKLDTINMELARLGVRVLIVIDDLDRVNFPRLKQILQILEICRNLHGTTFLVCFDSQSFASLENPLKNSFTVDGEWKAISITSEKLDATYIRNYLKKIITVKYVLPHNPSKIKECFKKIFLSLPDGITFSEESISGITDWLDTLFSPQQFDIYGPYISNIRDIKRLYNFFISRYVERTYKLVNVFDRSNPSGLLFEDFIRMLILYMHYDHIYQKILEEESLVDKDKMIFSIDGMWSLFRPTYEWWSSSSGKYKQNPRFLDYINTLPFIEKRIVQDMFKVTEHNSRDKVQNLKLYYVLSRYIDVFSEIENIDRNHFITNEIQKFNEADSTHKDYVWWFMFPKISEKYGMQWILQFLSDFAETAKHIDWAPRQPFEEIIDHIMTGFNMNAQSVNLLRGVFNKIITILDHIVNPHNSMENCQMIWNYLYGIGRYEWRGIIDGLLERNGIKGLYIALEIWTYATRGTVYFNFQRWVSDSEELNRWDEFYTRLLHRKIWSSFKKNYIDKKVSLFKMIEEIPEDDFEREGDLGTGSWAIKRRRFINLLLIDLTNIRLENDWAYVSIEDVFVEYLISSCFIWKDKARYILDFLFLSITYEQNRWDDTYSLCCRMEREGNKGTLCFMWSNREKSIANIKKLLSDNKKIIDNFLKTNGAEKFHWYWDNYFSYQEGYKIFSDAFNSLALK
jgi:hypothetical protein